MNQCQQKPTGLTVQSTQPLHHLMAQQNMALADQLYGRIMQLQQNEKQFLNFLRQLQSGAIKLEQLKISDGGFEIMPTLPTEMKDTKGPQGLVRHDAEAGGANNKPPDREKAPTAG